MFLKNDQLAKTNNKINTCWGGRRNISILKSVWVTGMRCYTDMKACDQILDKWDQMSDKFRQYNPPKLNILYNR